MKASYPRSKIPLLNPYLDLFETLTQQEDHFLLELRKKMIWAYSWAIPNTEAIQKIADYGPIVELGAGTGYWAWLLEQAGAKVIALDHEPEQPPHWHSIQSGDPACVSQYSQYALLLCWPSLDSTMAVSALNSYSGSTVIYIGEWGGRTADPSFHQKLSKEWALFEEVKIPNWPGYRDRVYVFKNKC